MAHRDLGDVHVLVVEDTDDSREMLRMALEYCGALVTTDSPEEAKRILNSIRDRTSWWQLAETLRAPEVRVAFCANAACRAPFVARKAQRYCQARCAASGADWDRAYRQRHGDKLSRRATAPLRLPLAPSIG